MDDRAKDVFNKIEQSTHLSVDDIYDLAHSIQHEDLSDEMTVRQIVRQMARLTQRSISQQKEDEIVQSIIENRLPSSIESLQSFFK